MKYVQIKAPALAIEAPEQHHWRHSGAFIWTPFTPFSTVSIVNFEHVSVNGVVSILWCL